MTENRDSCIICFKVPPVPHFHHTTPQAYGGKDSKQVLLCPDCHNTIHAHANAYMTYKRSGGKKKIKRFWQTEDLEVRAAPLVKLIVAAAENFVDPNKTFKMISDFDSSTYSKLKFIKRDLGLASLKDALNYCISFTFERTNTFK